MATLKLRDGIQLAFQRFGTDAGKKVLCLHGWLDNSSTFQELGPALASKGFESTCLDFMGHGHSDHAHISANNPFAQMVVHVRDVVGQLLGDGDKEKITLIGHSMGGSVALLYAASYPEKVNQLVLLESFGVMTRPTADTVSILRKGIDGWVNYHDRHAMKPDKTYTLESAVAARLATARSWPGDQSISAEGAAALVSRGTRPIGSNEGDDRIVFRHDKRLFSPSLTYYSPEQMAAFVDALQCPTLLITGENGWPMNREHAEANRKLLSDKGLLKHVHLKGSHHLHLDPETSPAVNAAVLEFLSNESMSE